MKKLWITGIIPLMFAACGSDDTSHNHNSQSPAPTKAGKSVIVTEANSKEVTINLYAGDDMTYSAREIRMKSGQEVNFILTHTGKMPISTMGHNFVLLKQGINVNDFANEALKYQDNDFIPKDNQDYIAHTKMLGGGESDTIKFTLGEKGVYPYLCTFTGHSAIMRGKIIVE